MAMGVVNDEDFERDVINSNAHVPSPVPVPSNQNVVIHDLTTPGRNKGDMNVPDSLRKLIGETSVIDGPQAAINLAESFGISRSSVSAYANGSRSTKTYDETPGRQHLNEAREKIATKARNRLRYALNEITPEKLRDAKVSDLAVVAKSMAAIVKDMEPTPEMEKAQQTPQFVIFAPQMKTEQHYEVIHAKE